MKDNFMIKIETWHKPDIGHLENVTATGTAATAARLDVDRVCQVCLTALCFQVHSLDAEIWKKVDVVYIDIADRSQVDHTVKRRRAAGVPLSPPVASSCRLSPQDYKPEEDPCKFKSVKTGRGPLGPDWRVHSKCIRDIDIILRTSL